MASRAFAYAGLALYEAVVPGSRRYQSLQRVLPGLRVPSPDHDRLDWPAVANAALATTLRMLFPTTSQSNQAAIDVLEASFTGSSDDALYGRAVADAQPGHAVIDGDLDVPELDAQRRVHLAGHRDHVDPPAHAVPYLDHAPSVSDARTPRITPGRIVTVRQKGVHPLMGTTPVGGPPMMSTASVSGHSTGG